MHACYTITADTLIIELVLTRGGGSWEAWGGGQRIKFPLVESSHAQTKVPTIQ